MRLSVARACRRPDQNHYARRSNINPGKENLPRPLGIVSAGHRAVAHEEGLAYEVDLSKAPNGLFSISEETAEGCGPQKSAACSIFSPTPARLAWPRPLAVRGP